MQKDAPFVGECNIQFEGRDLNTDPVIKKNLCMDFLELVAI